MKGCQGVQVAGALCYMKKEEGNWICSGLRSEGAGERLLCTSTRWEGVKKTEPGSF